MKTLGLGEVERQIMRQYGHPLRYLRAARVNTAILPDFGGANIGVPVIEVRRLLDAMAAK